MDPQKQPREWLVEFMKLKASILRQHAGTHISYFTENDAKAIMVWEEDDARACAKKLIKFIRTSHFCEGLPASACPFCIKYDSECIRCEYADEHEKCNNRRSDYNLIVRCLIHKEDINLVFSKTAYEKILEKLNEMEGI